MTTKPITKNIKTGGLLLSTLRMQQELGELHTINRSLQKDIDRPLWFEQSLKKEYEFGEKYCGMDNEQKSKINHTFCERCIKFVSKTDSSGDMECFASFFGMCNCMWQRYVARTYNQRKNDPFDMNDDNQIDRYKEIAYFSSIKKIETEKRIDFLIKNINETNKKLEKHEDNRNRAEWEKRAVGVCEVDVQRGLEERKKQAAKNIAKMQEMKARTINTKHRR